MASTESKVLTILLLGETGVGKSTWINGFANFLQSDTLEEAEEKPTLCVIPASFTMTDNNYQERVVCTGTDANEVTEVGQSATQHPQSYTFPMPGGYDIRLIDTPGIGDVRGPEQDKKNFELILDHISHLPELHLICILLKPNNARLNIMFSFCIKELLTHLHKDACANIVFCFTNSRSTFYRPGETLPLLRKLLEENKDVKIPLDQSTIYCMDSESIRFLYAMKDGLEFPPEEKENYVASWDKSVSEVKRLLAHANSQRPHAIQNTLSLNNARQTVLALGSPMAEISRSIQINIAKFERQRQELLTSQKSKEELSKSLVIEMVDVKMEPLKEPRTICTAPRCVEYVNVGGGLTKTNYKTHCHQNCGSGKQKHFQIANMVGHKNLKKCSAFDKKGNCKKCGCSYDVHMKITYVTKIEKRAVVDFAKQLELNEKENAIRRIETFLTALDQHLRELSAEQEEITTASVKFATFLKKNAITPFNDALLAYLKHFINEERKKVEEGGDPQVLQGLERMRHDYEVQMNMLIKAMESGDSQNVAGIKTDVSAEELEECVRNLYQLKHCGQALKDMMSTSMNTAVTSYSEKRIERTQSFNAGHGHAQEHVKKKKLGLFAELVGMFKSPNSTSAGGSGKAPPAIKAANGNSVRKPPPIPVSGPNPKLQPHMKLQAVSSRGPPPTPPPANQKPKQPPPNLPPNKPSESVKLKPTPLNNANSKANVKPPTIPRRDNPPISKPASVSTSNPIAVRTGGGIPPPPPPPPPSLDTSNTPGSSLLQQIQQKELKKINHESRTFAPSTETTSHSQSKGQGSGPGLQVTPNGEDMMDALKRALSQRSMKVQHSVDDDLDENENENENWLDGEDDEFAV